MVYQIFPFFDNIGDFMWNDFGMMLLAISVSDIVNIFQNGMSSGGWF